MGKETRPAMDWHKLLNETRLRRPNATTQVGRSPFQQDIDRIVFSAAFRRLAHKTQVHPLSENDNVHTRLTHSIEVASVGRSLGTIVGTRIANRIGDQAITGDAFGYIVQAACLAHDIGNPPFGHSGEEAICKWFGQEGKAGGIFGDDLVGPNRNDFKYFEGNAQGFRILTQLENYKWAGGLQLTYAVLGTFSKYPRSSVVHPIPGNKYVGGNKVGYFQAEKEYFSDVATGLGLIKRNDPLGYWSRHPLAFLVEAADDICYAIVDIEDGFDLGYIDFSEARNILGPIASKAKFQRGMDRREQIGKLRAVAIGELIDTVAKTFLRHEKGLLDGSFGDELLKRTKYSDHISEAKRIATQKIYWSDRKTKIEIAGSEIISGLLNFFHEAVLDLEHVKWDTSKLTGLSKKLTRLMPDHFSSVANRYDALLRVTDFISGMTDRYALELYRKLKGISV